MIQFLNKHIVIVVFNFEITQSDSNLTVLFLNTLLGSEVVVTERKSAALADRVASSDAGIDVLLGRENLSLRGVGSSGRGIGFGGVLSSVSLLKVEGLLGILGRLFGGVLLGSSSLSLNSGIGFAGSLLITSKGIGDSLLLGKSGGVLVASGLGTMGGSGGALNTEGDLALSSGKLLVEVGNGLLEVVDLGFLLQAFGLGEVGSGLVLLDQAVQLTEAGLVLGDRGLDVLDNTSVSLTFRDLLVKGSDLELELLGLTNVTCSISLGGKSVDGLLGLSRLLLLGLRLKNLALENVELSLEAVDLLSDLGNLRVLFRLDESDTRDLAPVELDSGSITNEGEHGGVFDEVHYNLLYKAVIESSF